jgi:hypothetical protein
MNYIQATSFAAASIELARVRAERYKAYMMEMNDSRFEVHYWRS